MNSNSQPAGNGRGALCLMLALLLGGLAWWIPARWRSLHPSVVQAAGTGTPALADLALVAAGQQRAGLAQRLRDATAAAGISRTNEIDSALAPGRTVSPEVRILGGPDPEIGALLGSAAGLVPGNPPFAADLMLQESIRKRLRAGLAESRSPGVQSLLKTLDLPWEQFVPAGQPGGQPLEAMVVLTALLYERERLSPALASGIRELAEAAPGNAAARQSLEAFYLDLLFLSRRLDWTSLSELTRKPSSPAELHSLTDALRSSPDQLPVLYAAVLMSGNPSGVARRADLPDGTGLSTLATALGHGAGAVRLLAQDPRPVRPGPAAPAPLALAVFRQPLLWTSVRTAALLAAGILVALGLHSWSRANLPSADSRKGSGLLPGILTAAGIGGFLVLAGEPLPTRTPPSGKPRLVLDAAALTKPAAVANSSHPRRNLMEPSTLITLFVFGALQITVYIVCLRKIGEILRLPEPAATRLRLLENEENLFDTGLYVGIGGTATALVMQVLQLVEANLLAAYASNLMGIICVAVVKIGHVRNARRQLILESQSGTVIGTAPSGVPAPAPNPFTTR
ncbi:MAG: hypothetical protein JNL10_20340 [Verrucomicrobiales bacterium]|nr:hypothetical protein [Verrucomicrobiales bacterium]